MLASSTSVRAFPQNAQVCFTWLICVSKELDNVCHRGVFALQSVYSQTFALSSARARLCTLLMSLQLELYRTERRYGLCSENVLLLSQKGIGRRLPTLTKRERQRLRLAENRVDDRNMQMPHRPLPRYNLFQRQPLDGSPQRSTRSRSHHRYKHEKQIPAGSY